MNTASASQHGIAPLHSLSRSQLYVLHCISQAKITQLRELPIHSPPGAYVVSLQILRRRGLLDKTPDGHYKLTPDGREVLVGYTPPEE